MSWLRELERYSEGGLFARQKASGVEIQGSHVRLLWSAWNLDRLIYMANMLLSCEQLLRQIKTVEYKLNPRMQWKVDNMADHITDFIRESK